MSYRPHNYLFSCLLASGFFAANTLINTPAFAQVTTTYKSSDEHPNPIEQADPDVTGLWYHINQQQTALANQEAARLRRNYPYWAMSVELKEALEKLNIPSTARANPVVKPAKDAPLVRFSSWSNSKRAGISDSAFSRLSQLADTLARSDYHLLMGWSALERKQLSRAENHFKHAEYTASNRNEQQAAQAGLTALKQVRVDQAIARNDIPTIRQWLEEDNSAQVRTLVEGQGWKDYESDNFTHAQQWFALAGNKEGLWLSLQRQGDEHAAGVFACGLSNTEVFLKRCADYYASQQASLFQQGKLENSIQTALALKQIRPLKEGELALLGWAASDAGQDALAIDVFSKVLRATPNNEDVAGQLIRLYQRNQRSLAPLIRTNSQVRALVSKMHGAKAWPRKQFMYSYFSGDPRSTSVQSKAAFNMVAGVTTKQRSGEVGLGNFDILGSYIGVGSTLKQWRWQLALDYQQLYSGAPASNSWFASEQLTTTFAGITGLEDTGIRGEVEWQTNGFNFYGNLAYSLLDQPESASVTGQFSGTWYLSNTTLATTVFRQPKQDSLLSYAGTFDAAHEQTWGYVLSEGASALVAYSLKPQVSLAGTIKWEELKGEGVDDNQGLFLRTDISVNIAPSVSQQLDYWRIGPYVSYLGYNKNLSGFTYGHGGYFSPDYLVTIGAYSELLTREAHQWQVKLSTTLGFSKLKEDDNTRFPLDPDSSQTARLGQNKSSGLSGNMMIEGQYRLSDNWIVAGYVGKSFAVEYQAFEAGFQLRWRPGKGNGVTSDELLRSSPRLSGFAL
ncbi:cellulose synthase [Alteromonas sp. 345S023]|uniref:Cellulose synthase n=1 Tax=Alteromonas profundi TaxID=2696062 RepID=A0A7X5LNB2_9ALTE|nr:cellulose synthase subunit BcsC-related outer membrane protein [Alteromonas profundi]NDV92540.1 cellulose synthase [Alteromonas profundi]